MQIWQGVAERNPWHAPGYFILLSGWGRIAGWSEFSLRALSLLIAPLAIAWTYRLGREAFSARVGFFAAAVLGTSAFFIYNTYTVRMYTLIVALSACEVYLYRYAIARRTISPFTWVGLLLGAVAMLYVHYFTALLLAAIGLYHLVFAPKNRRWWQIIGIFALGGLVFLPWAGVVINGLGAASQDEQRGIAASVPQVLIWMAYVFGNGVTVALLVALGLGLWLGNRNGRWVWFVTVAALIFGLLANEIAKVIIHPGRLRYLLAIWPLLALLVGLGFAKLPGKLGVGFLALWMVIGVGNIIRDDFMRSVDALEFVYKFPWQYAGTQMQQAVQPGDVLILNMPDGYGFSATRNQDTTEFYLKDHFVRSTTVEPVEVASLEELHQSALALVEEQQPLRIWMGYDTSRETSTLPNLKAALKIDYGLCPVGVGQASARFDLYARSPVCCLPSESRAGLAHFGEGIVLVNQEALPAQVTDTLATILGWSVNSQIVPSDTYSVALHVIDSEGNLVAQADYALPEQRFSCHETRISLVDVTPGEYGMYIIVYNWQTGQRLLAGEQVDQVLLGSFRVISGA